MRLRVENGNGNVCGEANALRGHRLMFERRHVRTCCMSHTRNQAVSGMDLQQGTAPIVGRGTAGLSFLSVIGLLAIVPPFSSHSYPRRGRDCL